MNSNSLPLVVPPYQDTLESEIQEAIDTMQIVLKRTNRKKSNDWWLDKLTCDVMFSRLQSAGYIHKTRFEYTLFAELDKAFKQSPQFSTIRAMILAGVSE